MCVCVCEFCWRALRQEEPGMESLTLSSLVLAESRLLYFYPGLRLACYIRDPVWWRDPPTLDSEMFLL